MPDHRPAIPPSVPGGYHSRGVPGEEAAARPPMRLLKVADPTKRVGRDCPLKGGSGPDAAAAVRGDAADRTGVAAGPSGTLFVLTARGATDLSTPVFVSGDDEAVAVFTTRAAAERYLDRAGWAGTDEVGVVRPADLPDWLAAARADGVRWVMIDPDRDGHLAGDPQPVAAIGADPAAAVRDLLARA